MLDIVLDSIWNCEFNFNWHFIQIATAAVLSDRLAKQAGIGTHSDTGAWFLCHYGWIRTGLKILISSKWGIVGAAIIIAIRNGMEKHGILSTSGGGGGGMNEARRRRFCCWYGWCTSPPPSRLSPADTTTADGGERKGMEEGQSH